MRLVRYLWLAVVLATLAACNFTHWSARQELKEQGFTDIRFGEVPGEPDSHSFTAQRQGERCSGIVRFEDEDGEREATIITNCRSFESAGGHS